MCKLPAALQQQCLQETLRLLCACFTNNMHTILTSEQQPASPWGERLPTMQPNAKRQTTGSWYSHKTLEETYLSLPLCSLCGSTDYHCWKMGKKKLNCNFKIKLNRVDILQLWICKSGAESCRNRGLLHAGIGHFQTITTTGVVSSFQSQWSELNKCMYSRLACTVVVLPHQWSHHYSIFKSMIKTENARNTQFSSTNDSLWIHTGTKR